jgi:hypothetical protein
MDNILGVPVRQRRCNVCREFVIDDGYGELIHDPTGKYACETDDDGNVKVAS